MKKIGIWFKSLYMTEKRIIISEALKLSERERIIAAHVLNMWRWPESLEHVRPIWYIGNDGSDEKYYKLRGVIDAIERGIDPKKSAHYHIVEYLGYTEEYFEEAWLSSIHNANRTKKSPIEDMALAVLKGVFNEPGKYKADIKEVGAFINRSSKEN